MEAVKEQLSVLPITFKTNLIDSEMRGIYPTTPIEV